MRNEQNKLGLLPNLTAGGLLLSIFIVTFYPVIKSLASVWLKTEDYSHGLLIIPISLYIIWRKRNQLKGIKKIPGRYGYTLVTLPILLYIVSSLSEIMTLKYLSLVLTIWSIVWALFGKEVFKTILFPLLFVFLMIPIPAQIYSITTIPLQLIVSKASLFICDLLGIPIFREGNVLYLPGQKLAVVQACSGLRSLMSLIALSAIFGYLTLNSNLLRGLLIIFSLPSAIVVNIFRVVIMIISIYYFEFDLTSGEIHNIFGVFIFFLSLVIVTMMKGILSVWDSERLTLA